MISEHDQFDQEMTPEDHRIDDLLKSGNCADGWEDIAAGEAAYDESALCWVNWENMVSVSRRQ